MAKNTISVPVSGYLKNKVAASEKRDGSTYGKTTGLRLVHFVTAMLLANEKAKETDEVLENTLRAEFPSKEGFQAIPTWRAYHNGQKHGMNEDGIHSTRYGEDGQPAKRKAPEPKAAKAAPKGKASASERKAGKAAPAPAPKGKKAAKATA